MRTSIFFRILALAIICFGFLSCSNQQRSQKEETTVQKTEKRIAQKAAFIQFEQDSFDFGTVKAGEAIAHEFKFKNTGGQALFIQDIRTSHKELNTLHLNKPISAGKSGSINIQLNTKQLRGKQQMGIKVFTNTKEEMHILYIDGVIE